MLSGLVFQSSMKAGESWYPWALTVCQAPCQVLSVWWATPSSPEPWVGPVTCTSPMRKQHLGVDVIHTTAWSVPDAWCRDPSCVGTRRSGALPGASVRALVWGLPQDWLAALPTLRETSLLISQAPKSWKKQGRAGSSVETCPLPTHRQKVSKTQPARVQNRWGPAKPAPPILL